MDKKLLSKSIEENASEEKIYERTISPELAELKDLVKKVLKKFKKFHLTRQSWRELESFFIFKANYNKGKHKKELRYNLLVQFEGNKDEELAFLKEIKVGLKKIGALKKDFITITEKDAQNMVPAEFPLDCSVLAICDCDGSEKESVSSVSSTIRSGLQAKQKKKNSLWESIMCKSSVKPDCTVIAVGTKSFVDFVKENEIYDQFFSHRIYSRPMSMGDIRRVLCKEIKEEGLVLSEDFKENIGSYIQMVYPNTEMKARDFIEELLNKVLVRYYLTGNDGIVDCRCVPFYRKIRSFEEISKSLDKMIGLQSVKAEFRKLYNLSRDTSYINKRRLHFAFVGAPGTGKTTVAKLTAELLFSMGLIKKNKIVIVKPTDIISCYIGESAQLMKEKINEAQGGVLLIDEAYFLISKTTDTKSPQKQCLELLIQEMENNSNNITCIFCGYDQEIQELLYANPGLKSRVAYLYNFENYANEELFQIFLNLVSKDKMVLAEDAYDLMKLRISLAKKEKNFGNARTMENLYQQLKAIYLERESGERVIKKEDVEAMLPSSSGMSFTQEQRRRIAVHEAGHAVVSYYKNYDIQCISINPDDHDQFAGSVVVNPANNNHILTESELKALLAISFAGRAAEKSVLGETSTGCSADIRHARKLAAIMVEEYAMGEFGKITQNDLLKEAESVANEIIEKHKDELVKFADVLCTKGVLTGQESKAFFDFYRKM